MDEQNEKLKENSVKYGNTVTDFLGVYTKGLIVNGSLLSKEKGVSTDTKPSIKRLLHITTITHEDNI